MAQNKWTSQKDQTQQTINTGNKMSVQRPTQPEEEEES
jgi:hypothetical protein